MVFGFAIFLLSFHMQAEIFLQVYLKDNEFLLRLLALKKYHGKSPAYV